MQGSSGSIGRLRGTKLNAISIFLFSSLSLPFVPRPLSFFRETWREMGGFQDTMYINLNLWHGESLARLLSEIVIPFLRANSPRKIPRPTNLCSLVIWHEAGGEGFAKRTRGTEIEIFSKLGFRLDNFRCLPLRAAHCAPLWFFSRFRWKGGGRGSRSFSIVFNLARFARLLLKQLANRME